MKTQTNTHKRYEHRRRKRRIRKKIWIGSITLLFVLIISSFFLIPPQAAHRQPQSPESETNITSDDSNSSVTTTDDKSTESSENTSNPESSQDKKPDDTYNFSKPVPLSKAVDDTYFDDAIFIGDSRTEGFFLYTSPGNAKSYAHKGLMVDTAFTDPVITMNGSKISVIDALKEASFKKVYIMLGVNETGWAYSSIFIEKYAKIVDEIKSMNPDALIYLQSILPVSETVSSTHSYIKNNKIKEYNKLVRQMAKEKEVYYLNVAESIASANGALPEDAASDGIHLKKEYCDKWLEYLKTHTVYEKEK